MSAERNPFVDALDAAAWIEVGDEYARLALEMKDRALAAWAKGDHLVHEAERGFRKLGADAAEDREADAEVWRRLEAERDARDADRSAA